MAEELSAHSWLVVFTFMVVIVVVIHPIRIPLPIPVRSSSASSPSPSSSTTTTTTAFPESNQSTNTLQPQPQQLLELPQKQHLRAKKFRFPYSILLDKASAPVVGVLLLLAIGSINGTNVRDGIVGAPGSGVEPYAVMILFYSLAYICISLDMTGIFQYAAFWISRRGGASSSGHRIFFSFFLLSTVMSGLASNDVVVLTMTPFLVYYSHAVSLVTPVAFLMAEIQTANIASMALYIGNITNVVACQAYKVSFLEYSAWMILPCLISIATCYGMLLVNFRSPHYIPTQLQAPNIDPRACLIDPWGAIFGVCVLASSLVCLVGTSFAHVSVWLVTGPFALVMLIRDIWYDSQGKFKGSHLVTLSTGGMDKDEKMDICTNTDIESAIETRKNGTDKGSTLSEIKVVAGLEETGQIQDSNHSGPDSSASSVLEGTVVALGGSGSGPAAGEDAQTKEQESDNINGSNNNDNNNSTVRTNAFERRFPLLHAIAIRMPWAILPFTFSMFIMVEGLSHSGWIAIFASWATKLVPNYIAATYAIGFVSVLLCNIFNNVPMTILVARILQHPNFTTSPLATPEVVKGCLFGLIVGSNLGACTTLISSLAGLMWDSVLKNKNASVGFWGFLRWNMTVMPVVIFIALSVVVAEIAIMF